MTKLGVAHSSRKTRELCDLQHMSWRSFSGPLQDQHSTRHPSPSEVITNQQSVRMSAPLAARTPTESVKSEKASLAARDPLIPPTEKVDVAATKAPTFVQPKNTTTKTSNPFKKLCNIFKTAPSASECDHELKLNSTTLRAQIICSPPPPSPFKLPTS